jgi:hypothetical protein
MIGFIVVVLLDAAGPRVPSAYCSAMLRRKAAVGIPRPYAAV